MSTEPVVWRERVQEGWIDYNGHVSEPYYVLVFGHATDAVMDAVGLGPGYRETHDASIYTVETHVRYLREVAADSELEVRSSVIGVTDKLLWIWHELWVDELLRATEEVLGLHVGRRRATPLPPDVLARARAALVRPPEQASGRIAPLPQ